MSPSFRPSLLVKPAGSAAASSCLHTPKRLSHVLSVTTTRSVQTGHPKTPPHASGARPDGPHGPKGVRSPSSRATCPSKAHLCHVRRWNSWSPKLSGDAVPALGRGADSKPSATRVDAVVIGAGQAGLSVAYHLQKAGGFRFVTLDANQEPGGAWRHRWPSLQLFSTRKWSSLPGYPMASNGACDDGYPTTREMAMYMEEYEEVMNLKVVRPVTVTGVTRTAMGTFIVETNCLLGGSPARWECRAVISAAGTHGAPVWPRLPGSEVFRGVQIHSSQYRYAEEFRGARVVVVGAGNSGAQILAEVSQPGIATETLWSSDGTPSFLPKTLSGKEIFDTVARLRQKKGFVRPEDIPSLHSIIMQPGVVDAIERGVYDRFIPELTRFTPTGIEWDAARRVVQEDGVEREVILPAGRAEVDAVIWCTGYNANTSHLARLGVVREDSRVAMAEGDMGETAQSGVFVVGYGNWSGVGSGSIPGAAMYARRAALAAIQHLRGESGYPVDAQLALSWPGRTKSSAWPTSGRLGTSARPGGAAQVGDAIVSRRAPTSGNSSSTSSSKPGGAGHSGAPDPPGEQDAVPVAA